ncbi:MAB_1171c family putative transporter [Streptomyces phaeochromogenes]|uniref:MAB_1171c family putative transporter n=1 Tax=Streptomyces phaeochromogenes TaxID=1923 RepID=UPI0036C50C6C
MDFVFYIPGVILLITAVFKLSAMRGSWRDPLMAASGSVLLIGALVCMLSAPPTISVVNSLTGIENFSAPLVYSGMSALSACYLVLMIAWRGGEPEKVGRAARLVVGCYALVIVGIVALFGLADVPVERTRDLDTYYANTPHMREMILLYLVSHTVATVTLAGMCLSWLREVHGLTRRGLTLIAVGVMFDLSYQIVKYAAIAARWNGRDWDFLSTSVSPPLVAIAGVTVAAGFALPRIGPSIAANLRAWRRHRLLHPLWAEMRDLRVLASETHWWDPPVVRLAQQEITILDGVLVCSPYLDNDVRKAAYAVVRVQPTTDLLPSRRMWTRLSGLLQRDRRALGAETPRPDHGTSDHGTSDQGTAGQAAVDRADIEAEAAMLAAAKVRASAGPSTEFPSDVGQLQSITQPHLMVGLAQALASSPVVADARQRATMEEVRHD